MKSTRIEALSDGIFAIAMTLLVLELKVPTLEVGETTADLWRALGRVAPHAVAYAVSFIILGTLWIGHHNQFHFIRRVDRTLLWINIHYLLCIAFLPFATALFGEYPRQPLAAAVYGATLLAAGAFLYAHWSYATTRRRLTDRGLEESVVRFVKGRIALGFAVYGLATALSFVNTILGALLFAAMPLTYILPGKVDRHLRSG